MGRRPCSDAATASSSDSPAEEAAYGKWLDQTSDREAARQDRIHGAAGVMPTPLWIALFFISAIVLVYILGFADSGERAWVQGLFMGSVVAVIATMLLLLASWTTRSTAASAGSNPAPWSARSSTHRPAARRRRRPTSRSPATTPGRRRDGSRAARDVDRAPRRDWVEIVATVLLAARRRRHGVEQLPGDPLERRDDQDAGRVNALRIEAARAQGLAEGQTAGRHRHVLPVGQRRPPTDDDELATFYVARFRPEFQPAFDAWLATDPLTDPDAPPTPFAMDEYRLAATAEAERLDAEAEAAAATVRRNVQRAANYVLAVVLFSVALFFAGHEHEAARARHAEGAAPGVGCVVFVGRRDLDRHVPVSISSGRSRSSRPPEHATGVSATGGRRACRTPSASPWPPGSRSGIPVWVMTMCVTAGVRRQLDADLGEVALIRGRAGSRP